MATDMGKLKETENHLVHNLKKRCIKKHFNGIHDRFLRDHVFRERMIEHDRDEDVCLKWDDLAEQYFYVRKQYTTIEKCSDFNEALSTLYRLHQESGERQLRAPCHSGSIGNGTNHRVLPPVGAKSQTNGFHEFVFIVLDFVSIGSFTADVGLLQPTECAKTTLPKTRFSQCELYKEFAYRSKLSKWLQRQELKLTTRSIKRNPTMCEVT